MSRELVLLFPSATHPGLPVASQILSTLRHLTAPGKGNELRAEQRPALVGVAALLGCERVQSSDLSEAAVQRASAVSAKHFKIVLTEARRLLAEASHLPGPSRSPSTRSGRGAPTQTAPVLPPILSPFATPKKYKYSSGIDLTGLLTPKHKHSPAQASPLVHSVTPSKRKELEGAAEEEGSPNTPSKRTRSAGREDKDVPEEDLTSTPTKARTVAARLSAARVDKERAGAAAFFALRPGASSPSAGGPASLSAEAYALASGRDENALDSLARSVHRAERAERRTPIAKLARKDWTCRERVWGADGSGLAGVWRAVREFEEENEAGAGRVPVEGHTVESLILEAWA